MKEKQNKTNNERRKKGLLQKILLFTVLPVIIAFVSVYLLVVQTAKSAVTSVTDSLLQSKAEQVSNDIDSIFSGYKSEVTAMRLNPSIERMMVEWAGGDVNSGIGTAALGASDAGTTETVTTTSESNSEGSVYGYLTNVFSEHSDVLLNIWLADLATDTLSNIGNVEEGVVEESGYDMTTRPWYEKMINSGSDVVITDPYQDIVTGQTVVSVIGAVYQSGTDTMLGVIGFDVSLDFLETLGNTYSDGTSFLMITSGDYILYHPDETLQNQDVSDASIDEKLISTIENQGSQTGAEEEPQINEFSMQNNKSMGTAVVGETTGWTIVYGTYYDEYIGDVHNIEITLLIIFIAIGVIMTGLVIFFGRKITKPISVFAHTANRMAEGEVDLDILCNTNDEVGLLSDALKRIVERLKEYMRYIDETCNALDHIAQGDYSFELTCEYVGEFARIKSALLNTQASMGQSIVKLGHSSQNISSYADQVAESSQMLAQGSTEQASAISELTSTIDEISFQVSHTAEKALDAKEKANQVSQKINQSYQQMQELQSAMGEISTASNQISNIIGTIDSIAFQTNILALNAAVEAARAGSAGKGFAVVADEVRNLATKSAEAAKNTAALIQQALSAIQGGSTMTAAVGSALHDVVLSTNEVAVAVDSISDASSQQAEAVSQVVLGIGQISTVVESNSSAAEESAATGAELAGQAETLHQIVAQFKIK